MSRSSSRGSGLNLKALERSPPENQNGIEAGQDMNAQWRNSLDSSGSCGRKVRALKPLEPKDD